MSVTLLRLAALAECLEGVDMAWVRYYRRRLRTNKFIPPIKLRPKNAAGYYVIEDGHHRTLAHYMEGLTTIPAEVDPKLPAMPLSWRWPRIAPVRDTFDLIGES